MVNNTTPGAPKYCSIFSPPGLLMLWGTTKVKANETRGSNRSTNIQTPNFWLLLSLRLLIICPLISRGINLFAKSNWYTKSEISSEFQLCKCPNATPCHHCLKPHTALSATSLILCLQSSSPSHHTFAYATVFYSICLVTSSLATSKGKQLDPWIILSVLFLCCVHMQYANCNSENIH